MSNNRVYSKPGPMGKTLHYNQKGQYIGCSTPGLFGKTVHTNAKGTFVGSSAKSHSGATHHFDTNGHFVGGRLSTTLFNGDSSEENDGATVTHSYSASGNESEAGCLVALFVALLFAVLLNWDIISLYVLFPTFFIFFVLGPIIKKNNAKKSSHAKNTQETRSKDNVDMEDPVSKNATEPTVSYEPPEYWASFCWTSALDNRGHFLKQGILFIENPNDILSCEPEHIREIVFPKSYTGSTKPRFIMRLLSKFTQVEFIGFYCTISWSVAAMLNNFQLRELYITVPQDETPIRLKFDRLVKLSIDVDSGNDSTNQLPPERRHSYSYDFSGMPELKFLTLWWWELLDYKCLASIKNLLRLEIGDRSLFNLSWLSPNYKLKHLTLLCSLKCIEGIQTQTELEELDLYENNITDISPLLQLKKLKYLDLEDNPILFDEKLKDMGIEDLRI